MLQQKPVYEIIHQEKNHSPTVDSNQTLTNRKMEVAVAISQPEPMLSTYTVPIDNLKGMTFGFEADSAIKCGSMKESKHSIVSSIKSENPLSQFKELERSHALIDFHPYKPSTGVPVQIQSLSFVQKEPKRNMESSIQTDLAQSVPIKGNYIPGETANR